MSTQAQINSIFAQAGAQIGAAEVYSTGEGNSKAWHVRWQHANGVVHCKSKSSIGSSATSYEWIFEPKKEEHNLYTSAGTGAIRAFRNM